MEYRIEKMTVSSRGEATLIVSELEESLPVSDETVFEYRLKAGIVLTESQLAALKQASEKHRCDRETARLLSHRDHTIGEIRIKLKRKGFAPESIQVAVKRYIASGVLDDAKVGRKAAEDLISRRPCGRDFLVAYLQKKQIPRELAVEIAQDITGVEPELERARRALETRWRRLRDFELETARTKAYTYLARRGFSYDSARAVFAELWKMETSETK
jgi:regulatory protein